NNRDGAYLLKTTDGGKTGVESRIKVKEIGQVRDISCPAAKVCFMSASPAVGLHDEIVLRSIDGGASWSLLDIPGPNNSMLFSIMCLSVKRCVVSGTRPLLTVDGGR